MASITRQLGRPPRGTLGIVRRSRCGFPQVVLTAPLFVYPAKRDDDEDPSSLSVEVFPTQFWLTCPLLREAIGRLESVGYIERAERRLQDDPEFRRQMAESHRAAAAFRVGLVPPEWRTRLAADGRRQGQWAVVAGSGVAGIRDGASGRARGVKCLHAHYADWVGRGDNPIGAWVARLLQEQGVDEGCDGDCPARCAPQAPPGRHASPPGHAGSSEPAVGGAGEAQRGRDGGRAGAVAAIDVGSHSLRLLVVASGAEVERRLVSARLGEGWRAGGPLSPAAMERALAALSEFAGRLQALGVTRVGAVATGVVREAANGGAFVEEARRRTGLPLRIISAEEEARLAYRGAIAGLRGAGPARPTVVVDVGGGSTEWIRGQGGVIERWDSLPLGAERLTEAFLHHDPPAPEAWASLEAHLEAVVRASFLSKQGAATPPPAHGGAGPLLVGVGGTASNLAAMDQRMEVYRRDRTHGYRLARERIAHWIAHMRRLPRREREKIPGLQPQRAGIILAGAAVFHTIMVVGGFPVMEVSETDLLEGQIAALLT